MRYFLLTLILLLPIDAGAFEICKCKEGETLAEKQDRAFAIFTGTVKEVRREINPDRHKIKFKVHDSWRGAKHKTISVYTSGTDAVSLVREGLTCGYKFKRGETYLVYSYRQRHRNGPSSVSHCSGTKKVDKAKYDLKTLGDPMLSFGK